MKRRKRKTLGEVTKKDCQNIANILCEHGASTEMTSDLAHYFKSQNPRFDEGRFTHAVKSCKR